MPEIIAEAGSNHNGSVARACELVDLAARAGATSVKFQFIHADGLYVPAYFDGETYVENSVYHSRKAEELSPNDWRQIWTRAAEAGITISAASVSRSSVSLSAISTLLATRMIGFVRARTAAARASVSSSSHWIGSSG